MIQIPAISESEVYQNYQLDPKIFLFILDLHKINQNYRQEFLKILNLNEDDLNHKTYGDIFDLINQSDEQTKEKILVLTKKYLLEKM